MKLTSTAVLAAALTLSLVACSGSEDDPAGGGGGPDAGNTPGACDPADVPTQILATSCASASCHSAEARAGQLDLATADLASRLVDVNAACDVTNKVLVAPGDPAASYLLEKLGPNPTCGSRMPVGTPLTEEQLGCVSAWITSLAGAGDPDPSPTPGGGGGGGGW
jgi:hypothetical protein